MYLIENYNKQTENNEQIINDELILIIMIK